MKDKNRQIFVEQSLKRDKNQCVICNNTHLVVVHHIIERRLFSKENSYVINNGATLCEKCHIEAEKTNISVEQIREAAAIVTKVIPEDFYAGTIYDKWGNIILPNGARLRGPLFYDESVQKILSDKLHLFEDRVKYPRTPHWILSPEVKKEDIQHKIDPFENKKVLVTLKMDGENTTMYRNHIHARSIDSNNHASRNWVKNFWSKIRYDIPEGWRICGENMYAKHSIHYNNLSSYFYGFSIWNDRNECLSVDDTWDWFNLLDIHPVDIVYNDIYNKDKILKKAKYYTDQNHIEHEGLVIRISDKFPYSDFKNSVAKYVRKNHIQTEHNWMMSEIIPNILFNNSI